MALDLRSLDLPLVGAPMAGGPTTPALAAAVSNAGGLGMLAAGYRSAADVAADLRVARALTAGPLGVNLFVVPRHEPDYGSLQSYRRKLQGEADRYGVALGDPRPDDDDWQAKLEVVGDVRPDLVSFTFGCPPAEVLSTLGSLGITTAVTVTSAQEADIAVGRGAQVLVVQGPDAGAHRGTFDSSAAPGSVPLGELVAQVSARTPGLVVAGGGVAAAGQVAAVLAHGATAVVVGTALLLADEAGTNPTHRAALADRRFSSTALTRAFTGRWARGLTNRFMTEHPDAPAIYPQVHHLTAPIRRAAATAGDPDGTALWAGTGFRAARTGTTQDLLDALVP